MIEINNKKLCESCFAEIEEDICPHCGFNSDEYTPDPMVLPMGTTLNDKILIGRVMGKGGFGVTYLGYDLRMEKIIAVKEYFPNGMAYRSGTDVLVADPKAQETFDKGTGKFYTEAEMVAQFNGNPNIVGVYDYFRANNTVYLIMEYLNGVTLKGYVKKHGKLTDSQALFVMDKVAAALSITHSAGVLHRDISPDNIMLCSDGKVKLIDFGAARQIVAESSSNLTVVMKPGYTPIEQYTKKGRQGAWTDIYALGASIYYALTGKIIDDPYERMEKDTEFESNIYGINDTLWSVIKKCTMINASDRYGSAIDLRKALSGTTTALTPEPVSAHSDMDTGGETEAEVTLLPEVTGTIEHFETEAATNGYDPNDNVYERTETKKRPGKKLIIGIAGAAAAVAVIAVGAVLLLNRPASVPDNGEQSSIPENNEPPEINAAANEEFPVKPLVYLDFETAEGLTTVVRTTDVGGNTDASFGIEKRERSVVIAEGKGAVGNGLYLDGTYGVDFAVPAIEDDIYTISFWFNADRMESYTPIIQMGRNVGMKMADAEVTWINFTQLYPMASFPSVWNRNGSLDTDKNEGGNWQFINAGDNQVHGINEWCLITLVVDGSYYTSDGGMQGVAARLYLNGKLVQRADASQSDSLMGVAPYILAGDKIEAHIGINYWDALYKGYIDELYVFDKALTAEQVKLLYDMGSTE